ncbi:MAG: rhomboid family intramembrane serine protease [Proteobacteria bacterium]|nr:MAG: rhomboid family intramembrane serine protease [Pseudomonadota bacterium]
MYHRPVEHAPEPSPAFLPPVAQPAGADFILKTWSGRLIALNVIVFLVELYLSPSKSLNSIPYDVLIQMGAKEPVLLAQGEWWRLFTPIFLHGNLLHLLFNMWALYAVAFQLEALLGVRKFLLVYFLAGLGGNILSSVWSLNLSVGASGSLFGLLGCLWFFERTIQQKVKQITGFKPKAGAYTVMVVANILFGFIIPQIDNAAHIGGLVVGIVIAYVILRATPNRLIPQHLTRARIVAGVAGLTFVLLAIIGTAPYYVKWRLTRAADSAERSEERYYFLSRLLQLDAANSDRLVLWHHFRLALQVKDFSSALIDFKLLSGDDGFSDRLSALEAELLTQEDEVAVSWLRSQAK